MDNMDKERSDFVQSGLTFSGLTFSGLTFSGLTISGLMLQGILINGNKDLSGSSLMVLVVVHKKFSGSSQMMLRCGRMWSSTCDNASDSEEEGKLEDERLCDRDRDNRISEIELENAAITFQLADGITNRFYKTLLLTYVRVGDQIVPWSPKFK